MEINFSVSPLTANQEELINKFNAAFYEAQTLSTDFPFSDAINDEEIPALPDMDDKLLMENFDESFFTNILTPNNDSDYYNLPSSDVEKTRDEGFSEAFSEGFSELVTPSSDCTNTFDYGDFSDNFEQFNRNQQFSGEMKMMETHFLLPPVTTIKNTSCWEFGQFLRHQEPSTLEFDQLTSDNNDFGHCSNLYVVENFNSPEFIDITELNHENILENANLMVVNQNDALVYDEPNFTSENSRERKYSETDSDFDEVTSLQCKWSNCYQVYETQSSLVKHIEKCHVELKRGEEFTCFWHNCPRKTKPFNARYKLLIHMRVHSGEKPNKCPFSGCNKAFSRLENLKIHQRSHTGERPYLCQFPTCTKSFSNSSDRAKHQRTHFDTKPYACQVKNCTKKYTDPSSLRKHVKNHTPEEQMQLKCKNMNKFEEVLISPLRIKQEAVDAPVEVIEHDNLFYANYEHDYSENCLSLNMRSIKQDLKNKISEKLHRNSIK